MVMDALSAFCHLGNFVRFRAGEKVYLKGSLAHYIYIVRSGELIASSLSFNGREVVIGSVSKGELVPMISLLEGATYNTDCTAVTAAELLAVRSSELRKLLRSDAELSSHLLNMALERLKRRTEQLEDAALLPVGNRICKWLIEHAKQSADGATIELHESERLIGLSLGGISRESVSRHLGALLKSGLITRNGRRVRIEAAAQLLAIAEGEAVFPGVAVIPQQVTKSSRQEAVQGGNYCGILPGNVDATP
jgi:CRP-like cAMP-binding protein